MVRSETDEDKGTAPPKPVRKMWTTGSIPATDKDFLEWLGRQPSALRARGTVYVMNLDVNQLNVECQMVYERQLKEHKERLHSSEPVDAVQASEPGETNVPEGIDNVPEHLFPQPSEQILSRPLEQILSRPLEQILSQPLEQILPQSVRNPMSVTTYTYLTYEQFYW